jgi:hypothetical protein
MSFFNQKSLQRCPMGCSGGQVFKQRQVRCDRCAPGQKGPCFCCNGLRYVWRQVQERCSFYCKGGYVS